MARTGIYMIKNEINGKFYIGSAVNIERRWNEHKSLLNRNIHSSPKLQNSWNKNGKDKFFFEIIQYCEKEELIKNEQYWINLLTPEYNILKIAGSSLGYKQTKESNIKRSISCKLAGCGLSNKGRINKNKSKIIIDRQKEIIDQNGNIVHRDNIIKELNISKSYLISMLNGTRTNKTIFKYK